MKENTQRLEAEVIELNEQMYSLSSDVNTMRLKEEEDQENIERLQTELSTVANMYLAEKKKNDIMSENNNRILHDPSVSKLREENLKNGEIIRKLTS